MDKKIKAHFGPLVKTTAERKQLGKLESADKKLDRMIGKDKKKGK